MARSFKKLKSLAVLSVTGSLAFSSICIYKGNETFYRNVLMPAGHRMLDSEDSHHLFLRLAKWGLIPNMNNGNTTTLKNTVCGLTFENPIGLAGGFDKDAEAVHGLFKLGFGFIEIGSVTPLPQTGNDRPRIFRLLEDKAVINRCGFNSKGHEFVYSQLNSLHKAKGILGISLGKNKLSENAENDYVQGVEKFGEIADYLVINVSSPNTPGLRTLQERNALEKLLDKVLEARNKLSKKTPLLIKIAPDMTDEWKQNIAWVVTRKGKIIDGLIISNTTIERSHSLRSEFKNEHGGLSGSPLKDVATKTIGDLYSLTKGKIPIIGVGGVFTGQDAYDKIKAGASLIQIYTALAYDGPPVIRKIKNELEELLKKDSFKSISEAVGIDHPKF